MKYDVKIYEPSKTNPHLRFILGTEGSKPLLVIGLNPSTANDRDPDPTMRKVIGFASRHGCDSFVILNLYAQRTTDPNKLHKRLDKKLHNENISHIVTTLNKYKDTTILAAWGETIREREYFKKCISDIYNNIRSKNNYWLKIGDLTKSGHPRHPSRAAYSELTNFNIDEYLATIK